LFDQASSSSAKESIVRNEMSCVVEAGYNSVRTFDKIRDMRKSARALESLVNSPGRVGKKPFSVTYSSSASTGYSQCTSSSLISLGRPRCAAEMLLVVSTRNLDQNLSYSPVYSVERPEDLFSSLACESTESKALLRLMHPKTLR
jgi:hypothetical protein